MRCDDPYLVASCLLGLLLLCVPMIVLFCTGPLVYKYYNEASGFQSSRCSISTSTPRTIPCICCGACIDTPCTSFQVHYDDPSEPENTGGSNKSRTAGFLNPDETSLRENGLGKI